MSISTNRFNEAKMPAARTTWEIMHGAYLAGRYHNIESRVHDPFLLNIGVTPSPSHGHLSIQAFLPSVFLPKHVRANASPPAHHPVHH